MEYIALLNKKGLSSIENLPIEKLDEIRNIANDAYHNGESLISDSLYDSIVDIIEKKSGGEYVGTVGAKVADKDERKTTLPFPMASMNKIKDISAINRFITNHSNVKVYSITDKLDGISLMYDTMTNPETVNLYTRGNGLVGLNVSHISEHITGIPKIENIVVRGELIMSKKSMDEYVENGGRRVPARNIVAGAVGSKTMDSEWMNTMR